MTQSITWQKSPLNTRELVYVHKDKVCAGNTFTDNSIEVFV